MTDDMRIEGLSVFYGRATAVRDASFVVPAGRVTAVVGTRDATVQIADGTRVRVDGDAGTVTVLE